MTPETPTDLTRRLAVIVIGLNELEEDSTLPGRARLRAAQLKKHVAGVIESLRTDPNAGLGAVAEAQKREEVRNGD